MDRQFAEFYQSILQNSLMPKEREDYKSALKTLKLTQETILEIFQDLLDNHIIEVDGEIIPDLANLGQSKYTKAIGPYDNSKIKKEQEALKKFNQHLFSLLIILKNDHFKKGLIDDDYNRRIENGSKVLFERFAHLNNPPTNDRDFKGQNSFTLKKEYKSEIFIKILKKLKDNKLIDKNISVDRFKKIFSGTKIQNNEKVNWVGNNRELTVFLIALNSKLLSKEQKYETAIRCFLVNGKEINKPEQISNSSGTSLKKELIKDIVSLF